MFDSITINGISREMTEEEHFRLVVRPHRARQNRERLGEAVGAVVTRDVSDKEVIEELRQRGLDYWDI